MSLVLVRFVSQGSLGLRLRHNSPEGVPLSEPRRRSSVSQESGSLGNSTGQDFEREKQGIPDTRACARSRLVRPPPREYQDSRPFRAVFFREMGELHGRVPAVRPASPPPSLKRGSVCSTAVSEGSTCRARGLSPEASGTEAAVGGGRGVSELVAAGLLSDRIGLGPSRRALAAGREKRCSVHTSRTLRQSQKGV